jgi:peptidoglycan/LPS O-acetylase OafA/YrhL
MKQDNSFDLLRFLAAIAVIFSHSYALTGNLEFGLLGDSLGGWGVNVFFVISGYLLAGTKDFSWQYFWKRSLRLFPALAVSII